MWLKGSGFEEKDVSRLVKDFTRMRSMMKQMGDGNFPGGMPGMPGMGGGMPNMGRKKKKKKKRFWYTLIFSESFLESV